MGKTQLKSNLTNAEMLSYIINQNPVLRENIDLPKQGEDIKPIGKLIIGNKLYRNAFINTINVIGLDVIKRNIWENPWDFTKRGTLALGQYIREMINDLANVYRYNDADNDEYRFLKQAVPNILSYIHEVNFQVYYETSLNETQMAMAFSTEGGLYELVDSTIGMLYQSLVYDEFLVDKYILSRRIVDGTVPSVNLITNGRTTREIVAQMKSVTNKMTFRNPNFNPAGIRRGNKFDELMTIMDSDFEGKLSTEVLATSYYINEAQLKTSLRLTDSFNMMDEERLAEVLGDAFVPFTASEKAELAKVKACVISKEWFMDYDYLLDAQAETKETEWYSPTQLVKNVFLHKWGVKSSSPFEQCVVFVDDTTPSVTSVSVSPATATVSRGQNLQLSANVVTVGFANKAVKWSIPETAGVSINADGLLKVSSEASTGDLVVTATSVYDESVTGTATITIA